LNSGEHVTPQDLWISSKESWMRSSSGHTSIDKLFHQISICSEEDVHVSTLCLWSTINGKKVRIVPLLSWHASDFVPNDAELSSAERSFDCGAKWPATVNMDSCRSRNSVSVAIAEFFSQVNEHVVDALSPSRGSYKSSDEITISLSHFLPLNDLAYPKMLERVMGDSKRLGSQVKALNPTVHLFGHSHINCQRVVGGTRYVQAALGYEREQCFGIFSTEPFKLAST